MRSLRSLLFGIALLASVHDAVAQAPELLSYQGVLTLANGTVVVDGLYGIRFSVYDAPSSGTLRFEQTLQVMVKDGLYNVMLSNQGGWSLKDAFAGAPRYMETAITAAPGGSGISPTLVLTPRQEIASVPYALIALSGPPAPAALPSAQAWSTSRTRGLSKQNHADSDNLVSNTFQVIPGLSTSFSLDRAATVHVIASGNLVGQKCGVGLRTKVDGTAATTENWGQRYVENSDPNGAAGAYPYYGGWTLLHHAALAEGSHTIAVEVRPTANCTSVCANTTGAMSTGSECTLLIQAFYD